jgi:cytoskeletal protein RodZ
MSSKTEQQPERQLPGPGLRRERERQGLRVEDIASLAGLPVHVVRAIEENRFEDLQSSAETWQSVASYARALDRDPEPWLEQLDGVLPQTHSTGSPQRGKDLLDDRWAVLHQRLVAAAVVAVLWLLYTLVVDVMTGTRDRDEGTDIEVPAVEETLGDNP